MGRRVYIVSATSAAAALGAAAISAWLGIGIAGRPSVGSADHDVVLAQGAGAAAFVVAALFLAQVARASWQLGRDEAARSWREPARPSTRLVSWVATSLVGLAAAPAAHAGTPAASQTVATVVATPAATASGQIATAPVAAGRHDAPTESPRAERTSTARRAPDPLWQSTDDTDTAASIRLVGGTSGDAHNASGQDSAAPDSGTVVVRRGDCLWDLVARHLGGDAPDAELAKAWPRWYAANRAVIGSDPDVLRPGQVLRIPAGSLR